MLLSLEAPRAKRFARIMAAAFGLSLVILGFSPLLAKVDSTIFVELMHGFKELIPSLRPFSLTLSNEVSALAWHSVGLLFFSAGAIWAGYKLAGAGRIVLTVQLVVLSVIYQIAAWQMFSASGHPLSTATAISAACFVGYLFKKREEERRQFEAKQYELALRNNELQESRIALVKQDESERRLLAADLHDQVLNDLRTIQKRFEKYAKAPDEKERESISKMMTDTMTEIREIMDELCPVVLEEFGLPAAIEDRLDKAAKIGNFDARFKQNASNQILENLSPVEKQLIYRLVQESLTNVCKHANASTVRVLIDEDDSWLVLSISDDGKGINTDMLSESSRGTLYMRLRAGLIGAKVSWKQGPDGKGTTVEIRLHVQSSGS